MGESITDRPTGVIKMGESVPSGATLEESVSFGRFENDALSWEKWSSFSPNKYLEEVEKCSTPGSVAQKKAYFEAHYKRIAARKVEQLQQEKPMESLAPSSDEPEHNRHAKNTYVSDGEFGQSKNSRSTGDVESEYETTAIMNNTVFEKEKEAAAAAAAVDCQDLSIEEAKKELNSNSANPESNDREEAKEELIGSQADLELSPREEAAEVQDEITEKSCQDIIEQPSKVDNEAKETLVNKNKSPKLYARNMAKRMTPSKKEQSLASAKKKVASPATKQPRTTKLSQVSTPRLSKSMVIPDPQSSLKKFNGSSLPRGKITSQAKNRKTVPLHMSLRLDPPNSGASFTTTQKSLIMEKMGDKDIVRRAFKTFQNSINGLRSSHDGIFSGTQQVSYKRPEQKVSTTLIPQKENGGLRKSAENINQRGHMGNRSSPSSSGSHKVPGVDRKYGTVVSPSTVRIDAGAEKRKEKLKEKQFVGGAERAQLSGKAKVDKGAQMKNVRQRLNSKSTLSLASDQRKIMSRVPSGKEDNKIRMDHQPLAKR